ncbi:MAG: UDP-N-acetylmuramoylalanine--D-glutamate ligase [Elusimicrobia bacterium GWA2_69_24]|nr:MAG: UDP-N-acetylmuramoylalanine--D-glutamate ligase [Elusimicrobia bacterium GWA2_69_24]HBL17539.1 UDP-N-acetylmuramoyl-L-alanine--D-glutamate ligase [Elusimicrobiota bacterium]
MKPFDPKSFRKKRAAVLGMGRSGLDAARLLAKKGFRVLLSDTRPRKELRALAKRLPAKARWEGGGHSDRLLAASFAVKSPGIPSHAPILQRLRDAGIPIYSELEIALAYAPACTTVAVTGSNGKSTVACMTAALFKEDKRRVHLLGNIGSAVSGSAADIRKGDTVVLEVSSYQLEDSAWFKPDAAAILNVTADHLEHHGSMEAYVAAKARVFRQQNRGQFCVFNASDPISLHLARDCGARKLFFALHPSTRVAAWLDGGKIHLRLPGDPKDSVVIPPKLPGVHNLENAMAAALLAASQGVKPAVIARGFKKFQGVEHRIEGCGTFRGIACVNDSKATNVDSTLAALRALEDRGKTLLLILGGLPKGGGFRALLGPVEKGVKAVLTIGSAAAKIEEDLQGAAHFFPCETLESAVRVGLQIGAKGDTLLLSPACASFDQFQDFEHRGRRFKELAKELGRRKA